MTIFQKYICIKKRTQIDMLNSMMKWIFKKYESQQKPKFREHIQLQDYAMQRKLLFHSIIDTREDKVYW